MADLRERQERAAKEEAARRAGDAPLPGIDVAQTSLGKLAAEMGIKI